MNAKFHNYCCDNTGKFLKISCKRCNFVKFDLLELSYEIFVGVITDD